MSPQHLQKRVPLWIRGTLHSRLTQGVTLIFVPECFLMFFPCLLSCGRMDTILDAVHSLIASGLSPAQAAVQHSTPSLGPSLFHFMLSRPQDPSFGPKKMQFRIPPSLSHLFWPPCVRRSVLTSQVQTFATLKVERGLQVDSLEGTGIRFQLNASALGSDSFRNLPANQTLAIKKVDWTQNRSVCIT